MLFVFDSSMINLDANCDRNGRALETLLAAFQHRSHLLFGHLPGLAKLLELTSASLSSSSRSVLRSLYHRVVEYKSLIDTIEYKVIVYIESEARRGIVREGSTWYIPLIAFADAGLLQTNVLCENEIDAQLYVIFAQIHCFRKKLRVFNPKARERGGGGSGLPVALDQYLKTEISPCLCLSDGDKTSPQRPISETSRRCDEVVDSARSRIVAHFPLMEREAENILPIDLLRKVSEVDRFVQDITPLLPRSDRAWDYLDIKEGFNLDWLQRQDISTKKFWGSAGNILEARRKACDRCKEGEEKRNSTCSCCHIPGLGTKALSKAVAYLRDNPAKVTSRIMESDLRWERLGKLVFEFTIAPTGHGASA